MDNVLFGFLSIDGRIMGFVINIGESGPIGIM